MLATTVPAEAPGIRFAPAPPTSMTDPLATLYLDPPVIVPETVPVELIMNKYRR